MAEEEKSQDQQDLDLAMEIICAMVGLHPTVKLMFNGIESHCDYMFQRACAMHARRTGNLH